jgi:hypothetical protein
MSDAPTHMENDVIERRRNPLVLAGTSLPGTGCSRDGQSMTCVTSVFVQPRVAIPTGCPGAFRPPPSQYSRLCPGPYLTSLVLVMSQVVV